MNRTHILREPGLIEYNSVKFYSKDAITITQQIETFDITAVGFGKIEDRASDRMFEIKLTPVGEWENLSTLFPYFASNLGADVFGASDVPLIVWTRSGRKYTFHNVAITGVPTINPKVGDTLLGEITFTALLAKDKAPGDSAAYYTLATGQTYPGDGTFSKAAILTKAPSLAWGASPPFDAFDTIDGVQIAHNLSLSPVKVNGLGTIGMRISDLQLTAQFQPAGNIEMSDILGVTEGNAVLGGSPTVNNLNITYSGFYVRLYAAALRQASFKFGTGEGDNLIQGLEARATRTFDGGSPVAPIALGYVGTSAPA